LFPGDTFRALIYVKIISIAMSENIEKYKINAFLDNLTVKEYKFAMKTIPKVLDVSMNTFHNYRRIKLGDPQDIPYEKVKQLEILFGIESGTLENEKMSGKSLAQLFRGE
jgi:hypothetical protein